MIRQKIENRQVIDIPGVDLTDASYITVFMRQNSHEWTYTTGGGNGVNVVSATQLTLTIPFEDAVQLVSTMNCELQTCWMEDVDGTLVPRSTDPVEVPVGELIANAGYNPNGD